MTASTSSSVDDGSAVGVPEAATEAEQAAVAGRHPEAAELLGAQLDPAT